MKEYRERVNKRCITGLVGVGYAWRQWALGNGYSLYLVCKSGEHRCCIYVGTQNTVTAYRFGDALIRAADWLSKLR